MMHALISIVLASIGQTVLKGALNGMYITSPALNREFIFRVFTNNKVLLGLSFYGLGAVLWIYALSKTNLARLYPLTSLSFVLVIALAHFTLGETVVLSQVLGILLIILGIGLVSINI